MIEVFLVVIVVLAAVAGWDAMRRRASPPAPWQLRERERESVRRAEELLSKPTTPGGPKVERIPRDSR